VTPPGIDPRISLIVVQCLKPLSYPRPFQACTKENSFGKSIIRFPPVTVISAALLAALTGNNVS